MMRQDKNRLFQLFPTVVQICKFGAVGVLNNIISLTVYYIVIYFNTELYILGNALGFLAGTLNAYLMNSRFVFGSDKHGKSGGKYLGKTYIVYTCSLGISTGLIIFLVQILGVSERIAPICTLMVTVPFNYLMNKLWIYREQQNKEIDKHRDEE